MKLGLLGSILARLAMAVASPHHTMCDTGCDKSKLPAFFLAGDSTTAPDGGWGDGFLTYPRNGAWGINFASKGATTVSFKADGYWGNLTTHVKEYAHKYDFYVTIQFGHNDQKEAANISHDEFETNLVDMAEEIQGLGAKPILISSLTRRTFEDGAVVESLADERLMAITAAAETDSLWLDLNKASTDYVNAIGEEASHEYNLSEDDNTHLSDHGEIVFGRMVADLLLRKLSCLHKYITPDREISDAIWSGEPA